MFIVTDLVSVSNICSYKVGLTDNPDQAFLPSPIKFSDLEEEAINKEILDFTKKEIIEPIKLAGLDEFISNIFVRLKSDGDTRIILYLKPLNQQCVDKIHFKMESLKSAINAMMLNCYLASVDLKESFHSSELGKCIRNITNFIGEDKNTNLLL